MLKNYLIKHLNTKKFFILNILLILIGTLFLNIYVDSKRFLIKWPDDQFHYLIKSTILKDCPKIEEDTCIGIKRLNNFDKKDFSDSAKINVERQSARLTHSYHPLFTIFSNNILLNHDNFYSFKIVNYLLAIILGFLVFYYINIFLKDQKLVFLVIAIYATHYFVKGSLGFNFALPATTSAFLSALSVIFLFKKKNYLFYIFTILSVTMHHVGFLFTIANYLALKIYEFYFKASYKHFFSKDSLIQYLSLIILLVFSYNLNYELFIDGKSSFNVYDTDFKILVIFDSIKINFFTFIKYFSVTIFLINPLTIYFFTKFFFKKDKDIILLLKLMFFTSIVFIIFIPIGFSSENKMEFVYGNRTWEILILNFLILSFLYINHLKNKFDKILKNIFLCTIPIFLCLNILLLKDRVNHIINYDNYYHDNKNFSQFMTNTTNKDKILIDLSESNFYYILNNELIKKNFFIKDFTNMKEEKFFDYFIVENPLKLLKRSSIYINNGDKIVINKDDISIDIIFYSIKNQRLSINGKFYKIIRGINHINLSANTFNFNNLSSSIYLTGIKLKKKQKLNWPWYSDFKFTIYTKTYKWNMFLDKKIDIIKEYDFVEISKDLSESFNFDCENKLISDVDSTLIFKLNCN
jgi:hypothetical protein